MEPRIAVVDGPLKGSVFLLSGRGVRIGQLDDNEISLREPLVSRHHSVIKPVGDAFEIQDLGSRNGTFVNDLPVRERKLHHGDRIIIGASLLVFLEHDEVPAAQAVQIEDESPVAKSSLVLESAHRERLQNEGTLETLLSLDKADAALSAFLRLSQIVNEVSNLPELKKQVLAESLELIPAERAVLLFNDGKAKDFTTMYARTRSVLAEPVIISGTIVEKVLAEGTAVMSTHILQSEFRRSKSLYKAGVESVLCVPLRVRDQEMGVIYLETRERDGFDEEHLRLLIAISGIAAVGFAGHQRFAQLQAEKDRLQADLELRHNMIGESEPMRRVYDTIAKVSATDATVLITGESGTGKELAARAIHRNSNRSQLPFVAINCAAICNTLLESELFGHEKGAFTGATRQKTGKIELAEGGTLFLDEVGELVPEIQAKLLRVLQEREFERVGGSHPIKVDIRLIAATNQDLEEGIKEGRFREDLYYRLNVITLGMPPLRKHPEDIPLLAQYFISSLSAKCGKRFKGISERVMERFVSHDWPGNVRELQNVIESSIVLGSGGVLSVDDLPESFQGKAEYQPSETGFHTQIASRKKELILDAIQQSRGNLTQAAHLLQLQPTYLHRLIRNLGIRDEVKSHRSR